VCVCARVCLCACVRGRLRIITLRHGKTMGGYDGTETCELVEAYILKLITLKHGKSFGLYRDDGLGVSDKTPKEIENIKKDVYRIFFENGLKITIETNEKIINSVDTTLNLTNKTYKPYTKPNSSTKYIHSKSNHPASIISNLPSSVNKLPSNEKIFTQSTYNHQNLLNQSGYKHQLQFLPRTLTNNTQHEPRNRKKKVVWYNPPYSQHATTKIVNKNNIKVSYSCMPKIKQTINAHNYRLLKKRKQQNVGNPQKKLQLQRKRKLSAERKLSGELSNIPSNCGNYRKQACNIHWSK